MPKTVHIKLRIVIQQCALKNILQIQHRTQNNATESDFRFLNRYIIR